MHFVIILIWKYFQSQHRYQSCPECFVMFGFGSNNNDVVRKIHNVVVDTEVISLVNSYLYPLLLCLTCCLYKQVAVRSLQNSAV